jgi:predicted transcriptional regulator
MRVLLSIKPEYAFKIFEGTKKFEFRKAIFKKPGIKTVVVYASSPVQQVIGEFDIDEIYSSNPDSVWERTKQFSGISKDFFFKYFVDRDIAHAIKIKNIRKYEIPLNLKKDFNALPPQSYMYVK